jgi:hypothetical protein
MSEAQEILDRVLEFIKEHPGSTPQDVRDGVPETDIGHSSSYVLSTMRVLKQRGVIENRGPKEPGQGPGLWYAIEGPTRSRYQQRKKTMHDYLTHSVLEAPGGDTRRPVYIWRLGYYPDISMFMALKFKYHAPVTDPPHSIMLAWDVPNLHRDLKLLGAHIPKKTRDELQACTTEDPQ